MSLRITKMEPGCDCRKRSSVHYLKARGWFKSRLVIYTRIPIPKQSLVRDFAGNKKNSCSPLDLLAKTTSFLFQKWSRDFFLLILRMARVRLVMVLAQSILAGTKFVMTAKALVCARKR